MQADEIDKLTEELRSAYKRAAATAVKGCYLSRQTVFDVVSLIESLRFERDATRAETIEAMAKAAFEYDWPKDKWERLGPGYHQDRYKGMIHAAIRAMSKGDKP